MRPIALAVAVMLTACAHAPVPRIAPERTASLVGYVYDAATGRPIEQAIVVVQEESGQEWAEYTNADGSYTIASLIPGDYLVRVYYQNVKTERTVAAAPYKAAQLNVRLQTLTAAEFEDATKWFCHVPMADPSSTKTGVWIGNDFIVYIPH